MSLTHVGNWIVSNWTLESQSLAIKVHFWTDNKNTSSEILVESVSVASYVFTRWCFALCVGLQFPVPCISVLNSRTAVRATIMWAIYISATSSPLWLAVKRINFWESISMPGVCEETSSGQGSVCRNPPDASLSLLLDSVRPLLSTATYFNNDLMSSGRLKYQSHSLVSDSRGDLSAPCRWTC